jgi:hypothetical protein
MKISQPEGGGNGESPRVVNQWLLWRAPRSALVAMRWIASASTGLVEEAERRRSRYLPPAGVRPAFSAAPAPRVSLESLQIHKADRLVRGRSGGGGRNGSRGRECRKPCAIGAPEQRGFGALYATANPKFCYPQCLIAIDSVSI